MRQQQLKKYVIEDYLNNIPIYKIKKKYKTSQETIKKICEAEKIWRKDNLSIMNKLSGINKRLCTTNPFENLTENSEYWIGMLATDGHITRGSKVVSLCSKDKEHVEKFKQFLSCKNKIAKNKHKTNGGIVYILSVTSPDICSTLISYGITPRKSFNLKLNISLTWNILRGIVDGDGYIGKVIDIATASKSFADQIYEFYKSHNLTPKIYKYDNKNIYTIRIDRKNDVKEVLKNLYSDAHIYLKRKYDKARSVGNF